MKNGESKELLLVGKLSKSRAVLLIAFLVTVWGINWPLSKIALAYTPPILFSGMRTLLGGLMLLAVAMRHRERLQFKRVWKIYAISALVNVVLYYGLQTIGLHYMPAGLFSAIVFLQPVLVGVLSWMFLGEAMYGLKMLGLLLGFAGVGLISSGGLSGHVSGVGIVLALASALSWAIGTIYVKKVSSIVDPIWLVTIQLIEGGLFMTLIGMVVENTSDIQWTSAYVLSLLFIALFVIAIGWVVFYYLINAGEASKVASYTFLIPLIAILIGTLFLNEPFTLTLVAGLALILCSIILVNRTPRRLRRKIAEQLPS